MNDEKAAQQEINVFVLTMTRAARRRHLKSKKHKDKFAQLFIKFFQHLPDYTFYGGIADLVDIFTVDANEGNFQWIENFVKITIRNGNMFRATESFSPEIMKSKKETQKKIVFEKWGIESE